MHRLRSTSRSLGIWSASCARTRLHQLEDKHPSQLCSRILHSSELVTGSPPPTARAHAQSGSPPPATPGGFGPALARRSEVGGCPRGQIARSKTPASLLVPPRFLSCRQWLSGRPRCACGSNVNSSGSVSWAAAYQNVQQKAHFDIVWDLGRKMAVQVMRVPYSLVACLSLKWLTVRNGFGTSKRPGLTSPRSEANVPSGAITYD